MHNRKDATAVLRLVNEWLVYDEAGFFRWRKTRDSRAVTGVVAGTTRPDNRRHIQLDDKFYLVSHLVWLIHEGRWPVGLLDHWDTNSLNDRYDNLREVTNQQNVHNTKFTRSNTGHRCVSFIKLNTRRPWRVRIVRRKQIVFEKLYSTEAEAISVASEKVAEWSAN